MVNYTPGIDKTTIIVTVLCRYFNITKDEFHIFIKKKENRYLLLLLLKNYKCLEKEKLQAIINVISGKTINYNLRKAEEKLLINKDFRELYFEIEEGLDKII